MTVLTLSLEINSLRLIEFSRNERDTTIEREAIRFFSKERLHRHLVVQEMEEILQEIKQSWGLQETSLHCILSSDFALLRVTTCEQSSRFISTATLVERDLKQLLPFPVAKISAAYQECSLPTRTVAYAAVQTDFLEDLTQAIRRVGCYIETIDILPLALCTLSLFQETLLVELTDQTLNLLSCSREQRLNRVSFFPLSNNSHRLCQQGGELPLLLSFYLKRKVGALIDSRPTLFLIVKTQTSATLSSQLASFIEQEFSISSIEVDPCLLLRKRSTVQQSFIATLLKSIRFLSRSTYKESCFASIWKLLSRYRIETKQYHISSVKRFTAPSILQAEHEERMFFLIYTTILLVTLCSILSLFHDYEDNRHIAQKTVTASSCLEQRQLELQEWSQHLEELTKKATFQEKCKELRVAHDRWPLLINELQHSLPLRGIWITQLMVITQEVKKKREQKINFLEIKGLYLEGIQGEELVHQYADKLAASSLFLTSKKENLIFLCSKEDGTAYAYPFTLHLPLPSPTQ
jgi:hypothetical protein